MESLIANDWLKDYGPLFDLFDEEMRARQVAPSDYFNEYDINNYYPANYKQTDDLSLSLMLGLEWTTNIGELNSPNSSSSNSIVSPGSSSASCSSAPSPAATPFVVQPIPPPPITHPHIPSPTNVNTTIKKQALCCPSSPPLRLVSSCLSPPASNKPTAHSVPSKESIVDSQNSNSCSPALGSSAVKRRKKCPRMKGTSLLAQPAAATAASPLKLVCSTSSTSILQSSCGNNVVDQATTIRQIITPIATPLSTLVTYSNNNNRLASGITATTTQTAATIPSSLTAQNLAHTLASSKTISTTITPTTNNNHFSPKHVNLITSGGKQPLLQLQQKQQQQQQLQQSQPHQQQPLIFLSTRTNSTRLDKTARYCVKIEHAYSLS